MRELSATLKAGQQAGALNPLYKIVLTKGASSYTYGNDRILPSEHDEELYSHRAKIVLNNHDHALDSLDLKGYDAVISYGVVTKAGQEYSATAPLVVNDQLFTSNPNQLTCVLELIGMPNLMGEDQASDSYVPGADDTKTVKDLVDAIVGATLAPFALCHAFDVVWDEGYDALANSYRPRDGFRIYTSGSRLAALRRVLDFTANVPRFEGDGKCHILQPVTSGEVFDSQYSLAAGSHTFTRKAYKDSLVFPGKVIVKSYDDDDPSYLGVAQVDGYDSLSDKVKKVDYIQAKLESNEQAAAIAEALIKKAEMGCARGDAEIRINVGSEVFDYVKITDSRQGDTRTGNLGYIHRRFGPDKWVATFGFGNWLEMIRYRAILKELETYTDVGSYFSRLKVGSLYATLDEIQDGPDVYVRQRSLQLDATGVYLTDNVLYTIRVPGGPQHNLHKSTTAPSSPESGDFWIDTNYTPNMVKMWDGDSWDELTAAEVAEFNRGTIFRELKSVALTADGLVILDQVQVGTYGLVKSASLTADGLVLLDQVQDGAYGKLLATQIQAGKIYISSANLFATGYDPSGKSKVFRQASAPTAETIGDLWVDTDDKNKLYRWSGSAWVTIRDSDIPQALQDAAEAYAYADDAYTLASGKAKTFRQTSAPTSGMHIGDIWIDTDGGDRPYTYSGSAWIAAYTQISGGYITTGIIDCSIVNIRSASSGERIELTTAGINIIGGKLTLKDSAGGHSGVIYVDTSGRLRLDAAAFLGGVKASNLIVDFGIDADSLVLTSAFNLPEYTSPPTPVWEGLMVYNPTTGQINVYHSGAWRHPGMDAGWA